MLTRCPVSSPGPCGTRRVYPFDQRAVSNSSLGYRFQTGSNASIDRQLAREFQTHANLDVLPGTTPGSSSTGGFPPSASSMSGPTTPYGHSMGHACRADWDWAGRLEQYLTSSENPIQQYQTVT